ncbi:MAG: DNA polymerase III subunit beta [Defluviitaleaceae bacterium]|nr:DNA polymerase III subunit beta [Defluviitaleaceae bacterium]
MNFICDKQQLQNALALVGRAVSVRTTMPILECVLLTAQENGVLTLHGCDKEISIDIAEIPAQVDEAGEIALDARLITEIVRKLSGESIAIETDEKFNAICKSGRSRLKIAGQSSEEFPMIPENELSSIQHRYTMKSSALKNMINQTIFSVSLDQTKLVLTGELMEIQNNVLQMVAIDMFRISYAKEMLPEGSPDAKAVIPSKALNELSRMLSSEGDNEISFFFTKNRAVFETKEFRLVSSLLVGDFIRYDQIHNEDFTTMVVVNRAELLSSFERAVLMAVENRMLPIKMDIKDDDLTITAMSDRGEVEDGIPCQTEGKDLTIYFNPKYFIDALRVINEAQVVLKFNTVLSPATIKGNDETVGHKYLIVPLRPPN